MRFILALVVVLLVGAAGIFGWQQSEISHLRAQVALQGAVPQAPPHVTRPSADNFPGLSTDERHFVMDQYRAVLTKLNLPTSTASRLQDLLTERIEAALDAQDAAHRRGVEDGSTGMVRAESAAIAGVDRQIASLLGAEDDRRLIYLTTGVSPQAAAPTAPSPAPVVINVYNETPPAPSYADESYAAPDASAYAAPAPYYYPPAYYYYPYGYGTVVYSRGFDRGFEGDRFGGNRFGGQRFENPEPARPTFGGGGERLGRRR